LIRLLGGFCSHYCRCFLFFFGNEATLVHRFG
jgi:hypothetical protein